MTTETRPVIDKVLIEQALTYEQYKTLIDDLLSQHRTTGPDQSEGLVKYTELNRQRMRKWDKTAVLEASLVQQLHRIDTPMVWLVLTEAWCGDAAQNIPVIAKMTQLNPKIDLRIILRDEHLPVMDAYLTNGARSIPKLIALDAETLKELGTWGPRPADAQRMLLDFKTNPAGRTREQLYEQLHGWYARNKGQQLQEEFEQMIKSWLER